MNRRPPLVALLAGAVAFAPLSAVGSVGPAKADGAPTQSDAPVARLVVDTSGMVEDERADTAKWIRDDGTGVLTDAGVRVDDDAAELEIRVVVMAEGVSYAVETSVWKRGAEKPEVDRGHRVCEACVRSEVLRMVTSDLMWVGGWLAVRPAPAEPKAGPATQAEEPDEEPATQEPSGEAQPQDEPAKPPSKALRNAGLAFVVPGGVALGVGIGLIAVGKREVDETNPLLMAERNYRPSGIAIAVSGGAVAAAGIALLVVHAVRDRRGKGERTTWGPMIGGAQAGVVLTGRF